MGAYSRMYFLFTSRWAYIYFFWGGGGGADKLEGA